MISQLQWGLIILGGAILFMVLIYNAWTLRKKAPKRAPKEALHASSHSRVEEPTLSAAALASLKEQAPLEQKDLLAKQEKALDEETLHWASSKENSVRIDPLIDCVFSVSLDHPVSGEAVLAALPSSQHIGTKPYWVEGKPVGQQDFECIESAERYESLQVAIQLANRSGPLNEIEFSEFVSRMRELADHLSGEIDVPEMLHEVARARELDQFASLHDAQLGFTLKSKSAVLSLGFVQHHAQKLGFVLGTLPGRMVLPAPEGFAGPLLTLCVDTQAALAEEGEAAPVYDIRLLLDVNGVDASLRPFSTLRLIASEMAQNMGVVVMDDSGQAITDQMLDQIEETLSSLYEMLAQHDLPAGAPQTRRLFS